MSCGIMPSSRLRPIVHGNRPCLAATLTVLIGVVSVRVSAFLPAGSGAGTAVLAPPAVQRHKIFNQRVHEHTTAASGRTDVRRRDMIPALAAGDADDFPENTAGGDSDRGSGSSDGSENVWARSELPLSNDQQVEQATGAVWKALSDGKTRQILRLSLPLIGATEMDDWPGGDRQRYKACGPMVKSLLLGKPASEGATVVEQILDESDAVGLMQLQCTEAKDDASAMIFPTTDTLSFQEQVMTGAGSRLVALVNPAWRSVSDFGLFGAGRAKKVLAEFETTYSLQSLVVYGYTLRLLYCYPGPWRLFLIEEGTGKRELVGSWDQAPPNNEVEQAVFDKKGRPSTSDRVQASTKFFQDSM